MLCICSHAETGAPEAECVSGRHCDCAAARAARAEATSGPLAAWENNNAIKVVEYISGLFSHNIMM